MVDRTLVRARLVAQGLVRAPEAARAGPAEAAAALLASQGQDLSAAVSSLALRSGQGADAAAVLEAFDEGRLVRGYPMRGTVFVVAAADLRWLTELCAAAPLRAARRRRAELGLDEAQVARARSITLEAADAPAGIARAELFSLWGAQGHPTDAGRGYHTLRHLLMTGEVALGPIREGENRIVLARRALPAGSGLAERFDGDEEAAVAELLLRCLTSRGPATIRDVAWYSKLPLGRLRQALPRVRDRLVEAGPDGAGEMRWCRPGLAAEVGKAGASADATVLLPAFDELVLGYRDRLDLVDARFADRLVPGGNGVFQRCVVRRGSAIGLWWREGRPGARRLRTEEFTPWPAIARRQVRSAFLRFPFAGP